MQVYIAKVPSTAASFDGSGTVWTKVYSSGLISASAQTWATDVVRALFLPCSRYCFSTPLLICRNLLIFLRSEPKLTECCISRNGPCTTINVDMGTWVHALYVMHVVIRAGLDTEFGVWVGKRQRREALVYPAQEPAKRRLSHPWRDHRVACCPVVPGGKSE